MFIPVGHDVDGLRRWPVVSFAIIAICLVVFVANSAGPQGNPEVTVERFRTAAEYCPAVAGADSAGTSR